MALSTTDRTKLITSLTKVLLKFTTMESLVTYIRSGQSWKLATWSKFRRVKSYQQTVCYYTHPSRKFTLIRVRLMGSSASSKSTLSCQVLMLQVFSFFREFWNRNRPTVYLIAGRVISNLIRNSKWIFQSIIFCWEDLPCVTLSLQCVWLSMWEKTRKYFRISRGVDTVTHGSWKKWIICYTHFLPLNF